MIVLTQTDSRTSHTHFGADGTPIHEQYGRPFIPTPNILDELDTILPYTVPLEIDTFYVSTDRARRIIYLLLIIERSFTAEGLGQYICVRSRISSIRKGIITQREGLLVVLLLHAHIQSSLCTSHREVVQGIARIAIVAFLELSFWGKADSIFFQLTEFVVCDGR